MGDKTGEHFVMPEAKQNDPEIPGQDVKYIYQDVTVSGAVLPEPFVFELQGQKEGYKAPLSGNDPDIEAEDFPEKVLDVPDTTAFRYLRNGQALNEAQLAELSARYRMDAVSGRVEGDYGPSQQLRVKRYANSDELDVVANYKATYSQHSSVVCSPDVQLRAVPYDLAIGRNESFKDEAFWKKLLYLADWRRPENSDDDTKGYYIIQREYYPFSLKR